VSIAVTELELQAPPNSLPAATRWNVFRPYAILLAVWLIAGVYVGSKIMHGWVPHDEGAFAQSADRILHGQLPHRDYSEIYTGGLAYLHAFAFRVLGENLGTLRIVLFVFFLLWVPVFYRIALRLVSDWVAAGVTLLAVTWSMPNYPAAVPSWYNLFLGTFGLAALLAYLETKAERWLFWAGFCGGLSFLVKNAALFYVGAVLLFFLFHEQSVSRSRASVTAKRSPLYSSFVALGSAIFPLAAAGLVRARGGFERTVDFVLPAAILAAVVLIREAHFTGSASGERFRTLMRMCVPFTIGLLVPILLFALVYLRTGGIAALWIGVFVVPFKRVFGAVTDPPDIVTILPSICLAGILAISAGLRGAARSIAIAVVTGGAVYSLLAFSRDADSFHAAWYAAYWLIPVLAVIGAVVLWPRRDAPGGQDSASEDSLFLLLALCSLCGLIQYPFSAPIYFCYVAPFVVLAAACLLSRFPSLPRPLLGIVFSWFLVFAFLRVTPLIYRANQQTRPVNLPRVGRLELDDESAALYERLIPFVRERAAGGRLYASPDCPQIYFLSGLDNPTRSLFDFFEADYEDSARIPRIVNQLPIQVVVINNKPSFSAPIPNSVREELYKRFPRRQTFGDFDVLWRD
jgi:Dolichyl-phosphate-mannose-protein mannosyltransferase